MPVGLAKLQINNEEKIMERISNEIKIGNHISVTELKFIIGIIYSITLVQERSHGLFSEDEIIKKVAQKTVNNFEKIIFLYEQKNKLNLGHDEYLFLIIHFFKNAVE